MTAWDEEDENLPQFFKSEDEQYMEEKERSAKKLRGVDSLNYRNESVNRTSVASSSNFVKDYSDSNLMELNTPESGILCNIPPEVFHNILKFLSSEDLVSCSQVCKFMNHVASDDTLWRRLYHMRWGLLPPKRLRKYAWKTLYMKQDEEDLIQSSRNCQPEFKEYYIEMHTGMRSEAPLLSQLLELEKVNDDEVVIDETAASQIEHSCSDESCSYHEINGVSVCEKTGQIHVCDNTYEEALAFWDCKNMPWACRVCGGYLDTFLRM